MKADKSASEVMTYGLSRNIWRIHKKNQIKANWHFYKHKQAKRPPQIQLGVWGVL